MDTDLTPRIIRTSDRIQFKRCRRKWAFSSNLRGNLTYSGESPAPLWFGTGFHFALEDFHGYNRFGDPFKAFQAFAAASETADRKSGTSTVPTDLDELLELAEGMFRHYGDWQENRREFETLWVLGRPMVELNLLVPLPRLGKEVYYSLTIDRLVTDGYGRIWMQDYKTYKIFQTASKLEMDPQILSYAWGLFKLLGIEVEGMAYLQFLKTVPSAPRLLKNGMFSQAKNQTVSYLSYRRALRDHYGDEVPHDYDDFLEFLMAQENEDGDRFLRLDRVRINPAQRDSEYKKILLEGRDMLNPKLPIYPNPTRDCNWDCSFREACLAMDRGDDWQHILNELFVSRSEADDNWRQYIEWPEETK